MKRREGVKAGSKRESSREFSKKDKSVKIRMKKMTMMTKIMKMMMMMMMAERVPYQVRNAREEIVAHEEAHEHKVIYQPLNFEFRGYVDGIPGVRDALSGVG